MSKTINTDPSCADDFEPNSLQVEQALARIDQTIQAIEGFEKVAIRNSLERTLAEDILSPINVPSQTNSAMDGYAVNSADLPASGTTDLKVIGTSFAGHPMEQAVGRGECARIMTGAVLPEGTDTVIMQEHVERKDDNITLDDRHRPGQNVRQPGEDLAVGQVVLHKGRHVIPADLGLMASLGVAEVRVQRRPRIAFFSTGDELRSIGESLGAGQIYDSNRYTLYGMLSAMGVEIMDMGVIPDEREQIQQAFRYAADNADAMITTGGVSVGEADFVKETLNQLGEINFWKIAMKPGRPLAFGRVGKAFFFGLPGNPVSAMVTFYQFVQPALKRLMGQTDVSPVRIRVRCESKLKKRPGRIEFQRGILEMGADGRMLVRSSGNQGSHVLSSMSTANCFIVLAMDNAGVEPGEEVEVQPFHGLL